MWLFNADTVKCEYPLKKDILGFLIMVINPTEGPVK